MLKRAIIVILTSLFIIPGTMCSSECATDKLNLDSDGVKPIPDSAQQNIGSCMEGIKQAFIANHGQLPDEEVSFYTQGRQVWFTDDGVWIKIESSKKRVEGSTNEDIGKSVVLKQTFIGSNNIKPEGRAMLDYRSNYFYGNDPRSWCTGVPAYAEIYYKNIYDGIDVRYYTNAEGLKYDFIVHPNADPNQIKLSYKGAESLELDDAGNLIINTPYWRISDGGLFIYQDYNSERHEVSGRFVITDKLVYCFEITGDYQRGEILVLDPYLEFSTFVGDIYGDTSTSIALDSSGNTYIAGHTWSGSFPTTVGAYAEEHEGDWDVFVLKLNYNGSKLLYSTLIGGVEDDRASEIIIDNQYKAYITGFTNSFNFPSTTGEEHSGGYDLFVIKLNYEGSDLLYSRLMGGDKNDYGNALTIYLNSQVLVTGYTSSSSFPKTDSSLFNGIKDIFVLRLDEDGDTLYSTLIGGIDNDVSNGISVDSNDNAVVTGYTYSNNFPTTDGVFSDSNNGGDDVFVLKLTPDGQVILFSTYIGGSMVDRANSIKLDSADNIYLTGVTESSDFPMPTTQGAFDKGHNGKQDAFILKLNPTGTELVYSTFIGGSEDDIGDAITIDTSGNAYITGETASGDYVTKNAIEHMHKGKSDVFVLGLNPSGTALTYSTFVGGQEDESGTGIALDSVGNIFVTGYTGSSNFPTTEGVYNEEFNRNDDCFVFKISFEDFIEINSVTLKKYNSEVTTAYARCCAYTFTVKLRDTYSLEDLEKVQVLLDPDDLNIALIWESSTGNFTKQSDPYDFIALEASSSAYNDLYTRWTINFDVTFNWTYPDDYLFYIAVHIESSNFGTRQLDTPYKFRVENDIEYKGFLTVTGEDNRNIPENGYAMGGEQLRWSGVTVVYQGTTNEYPPVDDYTVIIKDDRGHSQWWDLNPSSGKQIFIQTVTHVALVADSYEYTIFIEGLPPDIEVPSLKYRINADSQVVWFYDPIPTELQVSNYIIAGITITDNHTGVNSSSVAYKQSMDNGLSWSDWIPADGIKDGLSFDATTDLNVADGKVNLIKWRAKDTVGNGPTESPVYVIEVDKNYIPYFAVELKLSESELTMARGNSAVIYIEVKNTGEFEDTIYLSKKYNSSKGIECNIEGNISVKLESGSSAQFSMTVAVALDATAWDTITVTATSIRSESYGITFQAQESLEVKILGISDTGPNDNGESMYDTEDKSEQDRDWMFYILIVMMVLAVISVLGFIIQRRRSKKEEQEDSEEEAKEKVTKVKTRRAAKPEPEVKVVKVIQDAEVSDVAAGERTSKVTLTKKPRKKDSKMVDLEEVAPGVWDENK